MIEQLPEAEAEPDQEPAPRPFIHIGRFVTEIQIPHPDSGLTPDERAAW